MSQGLHHALQAHINEDREHEEESSQHPANRISDVAIGVQELARNVENPYGQDKDATNDPNHHRELPDALGILGHRTHLPCSPALYARWVLARCLSHGGLVPLHRFGVRVTPACFDEFLFEDVRHSISRLHAQSHGCVEEEDQIPQRHDQGRGPYNVQLVLLLNAETTVELYQGLALRGEPHEPSYEARHKADCVGESCRRVEGHLILLLDDDTPEQSHLGLKASSFHDRIHNRL
mmetsp:Transcript_5621/g.11157  ORF Transcript_5621/g.11157 Transcript_5621/m.11157 type:complete len:235 (-) Transcript_5621:525-1229(-)